MSYAVFKHRVFDITIVVRRGLAYAILSLLIGLIYGLNLWFLSRWTEALHASVISGLVFVFAVGLLYAPLLNYLQRTVDRLFFRAEADRQRMIEHFARDAAATIDLDALSRALCELIEKSFRPRRTSLFLDDGKGELVHFGSHDGHYSPGQWPSGTRLPVEYANFNGSSPASAVRVFAPRQVESQKAFQITEGDDALVVPIVHRNERLGCLLLEPKRADEPYDDDDLQMAEMIAAQSAIALQNARSFSQLEQLQNLTRITLDGLTAGVLVVSNSERIVQANRAAHLICSTQGLFPTNLKDLGIQHRSLASEIRYLLENGTAHDDIELHLEGDQNRTVLISSRQVGEQNGESLCLIILYDITNYKELEGVALRRESLARIGEAITSINHEIKNVLQPVRYQISNLLQTGITESSLKQAMAIIPERLGALEQLLTNLKDLSRPIELRLREFDALEMVEAAWRDVNELPIAKSVHCRIVGSESSVLCTADGSLMRQVMFNVLRNAAESTITRTHAEVTGDIAKTDSEMTLTVNDNGCGIDDTAKGKLFTLFYSTKGEAGTGLGLSICKKIVELHGGKIQITSRIDEGTSVRISVPNRLSPNMVERLLPDVTRK